MRRFLTGMTALVLAATASACGSSGSGTTSGDGVTTVKVGTIPIVDVAPLYLGRNKGFFASRKIEIVAESGQGGAAIVPGVVSGQFQFGFCNITSLLVAQTKNLPVKAVAAGVASTGETGKDFGGVVVAEDSPITDAAGLAGRKVAVNTLKNIGDTTVRESVRKAGGDPSGITFVEIPFPNMAAALSGGQVDAAWAVEPQFSQMTSAGGRVVSWSFVDTAPDLTVAAYVASNKLLADDPELVERFTAAVNESLAYADAHPDEVRQVLGTYTKIDPKVAAGMTLPKWPTEINRASVETLARLGTADGIFDGATPDAAKVLP